MPALHYYPISKFCSKFYSTYIYLFICHQEFVEKLRENSKNGANLDFYDIQIPVDTFSLYDMNRYKYVSKALKQLSIDRLIALQGVVFLSILHRGRSPGSICLSAPTQIARIANVSDLLRFHSLVQRNGLPVMDRLSSSVVLVSHHPGRRSNKQLLMKLRLPER